MKELYKYRSFLKTCIKKEIRGKYKGAALGILWSFINPLLTALIYTLIFTVILKNPEKNFVVYLIIGLLPWNYFQIAVTESSKIFIKNDNIVKKVYFPRKILPISVNVAFLINYIISLPIIITFLIIYGIGLSWYCLLFPLVLLVQFILIHAITLLVSSITVYLRDFEHILLFLLNLLFYGTPVLYSVDLFKNNTFIYNLIKINPLSGIINGYRDIFYYQRFPNFFQLLYVLIFSFCLLFITNKIFNKLSKKFAEEL